MSNKTLYLDDRLYSYLLENSLREPELMRKLREKTAEHPDSEMQIAPEQGQFMRLLIHLMGAKNIIEIGTYTGYSALAMALALPSSGQLTCCDINREYMSIGLPYWKEAGVSNKISFIEGPAVDSLNNLLALGLTGSFDLAFIDADKANYQNYFELCLKLVRTGGLILIDNTLWGGSVCNKNDRRDSTSAIREFNKKIHLDKRVNMSLLPLADGLTLAIKC